MPVTADEYGGSRGMVGHGVENQSQVYAWAGFLLLTREN